MRPLHGHRKWAISSWCKNMSVSILNEKIRPNVIKYSLSQGVRVAMTHLKSYYPNESPTELYERLQFKSNASLSFAKSELSKIEFIETPRGKNVEIVLNFMGLFGASSPLPSHYSEMVLDSLDEDRSLHDFINLFNHHIQKMIFPIWQKQRYYIQYESTLEDKFSKYMLSLLGLYSQSKMKNSSLNFRKLLPFIGILSMKQKSARSILSIVRHYLAHDDLEIVQCIPMVEEIPSWQFSRLGDMNCSLGSDTLIGTTVRSKSSKIQILLNNVSFEMCMEYSLHGNKIRELQELMNLTVNEPLEFELCLKIPNSEIESWKLSQHHLGINSFLGRVDKEQTIKLNY